MTEDEVCDVERDEVLTEDEVSDVEGDVGLLFAQDVEGRPVLTVQRSRVDR